MNIFNEVYTENKELDKLFNKEYDNTSSDTMKKNILELSVELGEFANETKCFKYWSVKKMNKEESLEEFSDCLLMVLFFCNDLDISLEEDFPKIDDKDIIVEFNTLFNLSSGLMFNYNKDQVKKILSHLINLGYLFEFSDEEIIRSSLIKIKIDKERFNINY